VYFWRIHALKRELATGPMPARRALPYLAATLGLLMLGTTAAPGDEATPSWWYGVLGLYYAVATIVGVWWSYRANGGVDGADVTARILAVWWVVGIRFLVILAVPLVFLHLVLAPDTGEGPGAPLLADAIGAFAFTVPFYWRATVHLRDLRRATEHAETVAGIGEPPQAAI
jgi:hypothetical protein